MKECLNRFLYVLVVISLNVELVYEKLIQKATRSFYINRN